MTRGVAKPFPALIPALALTMFLLASCGGASRLGLTYSPIPGAILQRGTVQLVVRDARPVKNLVGPEAMNRNLFKGSQDGLVDLKVSLPTGETVARSMLTVESAVFEAVKERLRLQGVTAQTGVSGAKARVTVSIVDLSIDVQGSDLASHIRLEAVMDRPGIDLVTRTWAEADSSKMKLIGDMGGAQSLSEALTMAVNRLDFSTLDRFQQ
ncbi:MAG: hypothetical protein LBG06_09950 [Deltaproteobacteria bacterium]|jgi:hypothetical protein|nr:hypothetical protein [Deltaproteobacteria bacterium]